MFGLLKNQEREEANMAATQNSPPLDLLGEIWGGGFALLLEERTKRRKAWQQTDEYWQWKQADECVYCAQELGSTWKPIKNKICLQFVSWAPIVKSVITHQLTHHLTKLLCIKTIIMASFLCDRMVVAEIITLPLLMHLEIANVH